MERSGGTASGLSQTSFNRSPFRHARAIQVPPSARNGMLVFGFVKKIRKFSDGIRMGEKTSFQIYGRDSNTQRNETTAVPQRRLKS